MSPNLLLRLASGFAALVVGYFAGTEFFKENKDILFFVTQAIAFTALALLGTILWLASKTKWGRRIIAIVQSVIAVAEAERGGRSDLEVRERAIDLVMESIPPGKLNSLLKMPWVGRRAVGALIDLLATSTKTMLQTLPNNVDSAQFALDNAIKKGTAK